MKHFGQCPCCHVTYELGEDDLGQLLECECGATLFACHVLPSATIDVVCDQCGEGYELAGQDAGLPVECECGHQFAVPTALLRQPMGFTDRADEQPNVSSGTAPRNVERALSTQQPTDESGRSFAIDTSEPPDKCDEKPASNQSSRKSKKDPLAWIGVGAVAILLVVAIAMFARRNLSPPSTASNAAKPAVRQPPVSEASLPPAAASNDSINPSESAGNIAAISPLEVTTPLIESIVREPDQVEAGDNAASPDQFPIPSAPLYALPEPQKAPPRIPLSTERQPYMTLRSGVEEAFESYEETQQLMLTAEQTKSDTDRFAYEQSMGRTLALLEHVHGLAAEAQDVEQLNSMRYLLAYLYYSAGHLPESCIMGQAVARWGTADDPATKEAALIALAAAQEASDTQWGLKDRVGELTMMQSIVEVLADRWPEDDQLGLIWMNLGYLYEAYNYPDQAVDIYRRIPAKSEQYADAQIATGTAIWLMARRRAIETGESIEKTRLREAQRFLKRGLRELEKSDPKLDERSLEVRLGLAQIALVDDQPAEALDWLVVEGEPIVDLFRLSDAPDQKDRVPINEFTARQVFDALYYAHRQLGDAPAANQVLEQLVATIDSVEIDLEARLVSMVKQSVDRLKAKSVVTPQDVDQFAELAQPILDDEERFPTANLLWLGESWGQIAEKTKDPSTITRCAAQAAEIYGIAMTRTDFPSTSMQSAQLRRIDLLRKSGNVTESLRLIEEVLAKTPNVFAMQIAAAQSLQDLGVASGQVADLQTAIDGPPGFSPIWGWGKLVSSLYAARWSGSGTDTHAQQLLFAQFHLAQCQLLVAQRTGDITTRRMKLSEIERSLQRILATMDTSNPWHPKFQSLATAVEGKK